MNPSMSGGLAAFVCAGTYLVGFALLVTILAPTGYGTADVDAAAVVALAAGRPGVLIAWNTTIYIVNALALVVLVVALHARLARSAPGWAEAGRAFGLVWAALVLGAGMVANVAVERATHLAATDAAAAAEAWSLLHAVELGLGGGNEIAGGVWILCVSAGGLAGGALGRGLCALGAVTGLAGLATLIPALGEGAGAVFGLGAIAWFLGVGATLVAASRRAARA
ncbi:hypothetical protein P6F26_04900 [Roseibacterium sp. SDUM158017]|uniref:hypothetical protein n=1 Tax=Roseicyclus salinarum TaxID=3036773 RepID=UPI00241527A2|nr:hypothetical protein [Roseibacterium sp. SDUM158017]MDG4647771.1 hypothetical protein [Roseibacterium sp. SDUM158017]